MKCKILSIAIVLLLIFVSMGAIANATLKEQESVENSSLLFSSDMNNRYALSVGVNKNLNFCDDDARALNRILVENSWPADNCWVYSDKGEADSSDVSKSTIVAKLEDIRDNYEDENSVTFFSFSGHGGRSGDSSYICFSPGNLAASELHDILDGFEGKVVCVFDSCHAGGMTPSSQVSFNPSEYVTDFITTVGSGNDNVYLLMACRIDQTTVEDPDVVKYVKEMKGDYGDGAGIWSFFVWDALRGEAEQNNDGKITGGEVFDYAGPNCADYADDHNWDIDPQEWGDSSIPIIGGSAPPTGAVEVTVNMKQIKEIDDIEPFFPMGYCEWYYTIKIYTEENIYISTKYQSTSYDNDNWEFSHVHKFNTNKNLVNIELRVMEDDYDPLDFIPFYKDDMADISSDVGPDPGKLDNLEWTEIEYFNGKFDNAIFTATYDVANNKLASGSDSCDTQLDSNNHLTVKTSGDMQPDGTTGTSGEDETNDAFVKFIVWSDYAAPSAEITNSKNKVVENAELPFTCKVEGGIAPFTYLWDFGDGQHSNIQNPKHTYRSNSVGNRLVKLTVTDGAGVETTDTLNVEVKRNSKPNTPSINGPDEGAVGTSYTYKFKCNDPDSAYYDKLYYKIDWGDGKNTGWLGPFNPGHEESVKHKWTEKGRYTIRFDVKDLNSETNSVSSGKIPMPRSRPVVTSILELLMEKFPIFQKFFQFFPIV